MAKMTKEKLKKILAGLNIEVRNGKIRKKAVQALLEKITADKAESGHLTDEHHDKVLDAISEWRDYTEGYDQPEDKLAKDMCLKALDCAAHCLSMAADSCKELGGEEGGEVEMIEEIEELGGDEGVEIPDISKMPPGME